MFLELYDGLGDTAFRQGLRNLYLMSAEDVAAWYRPGECGGIDAALCHLKEAFFTGMTPEQRAIADEIITRRYFGASPVSCLSATLVGRAAVVGQHPTGYTGA